MLRKGKRLANIMAVLSISHALYDFASRYCNESHYLFTWPVIELTDRTFHPILNAHVLTKTSKSEEFVPQLNSGAVDSTIRGTDFDANRCGDIILL